jgi:hypothetical protein
MLLGSYLLVNVSLGSTTKATITPPVPAKTLENLDYVNKAIQKTTDMLPALTMKLADAEKIENPPAPEVNNFLHYPAKIKYWVENIRVFSKPSDAIKQEIEDLQFRIQNLEKHKKSLITEPKTVLPTPLALKNLDQVELVSLENGLRTKIAKSHPQTQAQLRCGDNNEYFEIFQDVLHKHCLFNIDQLQCEHTQDQLETIKKDTILLVGWDQDCYLSENHSGFKKFELSHRIIQLAKERIQKPTATAASNNIQAAQAPQVNKTLENYLMIGLLTLMGITLVIVCTTHQFALFKFIEKLFRALFSSKKA